MVDKIKWMVSEAARESAKVALEKARKKAISFFQITAMGSMFALAILRKDGDL